MKCFAKDFFSTLQARIVIFGMNVNDSLMYSEIENQLILSRRGIKNPASPAYSSLYLSNFLPMLTLKNEGFRQGFLYNLAS